MKCKLLFTTLFLTISFLSIGQNRKVRFTPKVGVAFNSVQFHTSDFTHQYEFSPLLVGIETSFDLNDKLELATDLLYIRKGAHYKSSIPSIYYDYTFDYIVLSPNIKFQLSSKSDLKAVLGVYGGISTIGKVELSDDIYINYHLGIPQYKSFDLGGNIGVSKNQYVSICIKSLS